VSGADVARAARRVFEARLRLGMLDPPERYAAHAYSRIPASVIGSAAHMAKAREAVQKGARQKDQMARY
jgi:hypothetical protein